jgi:hypothetical protein
VTSPIAYRPMAEDDLDQVYESNGRAFADLDRRNGGAG